MTSKALAAASASVGINFDDPALEAYLAKNDVRLFKPGQYMDKWRLAPSGTQAVANTRIKRALGFSDVQPLDQR